MKPEDCPQIDVLLCGGPLCGGVASVPMLPDGNLPERIRVRESHSHSGDDCLSSFLVYEFQPGAHPNLGALYKWSERDVVVADLSA